MPKADHNFVPYNGKIADINEDDTDKHTLDLETALSETRTIVAVFIWVSRISGSGNMLLYPNEGTQTPTNYTNPAFLWEIVIKEGTQRLQYAQSAANDDFDMYCMGYVVEI